jgi:hypothetical protein
MSIFNLFATKQSILFFSSFIILIASIFCFEILKKYKLSLLLLFIAAIGSYFFSALIDPFLNSWDEQFHALVAKNLLLHPLKPTLIDSPIIPYDYTNWTDNYIWLHKQPLFLWQIALSIKLFGINELSVRIPSIIMMSIIPLFIYRIGKISINERVGYYAGVLFCTSFFAHEIVSGFPPSDHNDAAFLFYITASIWAWVEYEQSRKTYWLILIGLFSGCAVLVKWIIGLLIYGGWGLSLILNKEKRTSLNFYKNIFLSFCVCLIVFIPWQLYIMHTFPLESSYEYSLNTKHFMQVVEGHGGNAWFYFDNLSNIYGNGLLVPYAILLSFVFFYKSIKENIFKIAFFSIIIFVYLFFTLAATKMSSFCFIVSPFIFLSLASLIDFLLLFIKNKLVNKIMVYQILCICLLSVISWENINFLQIAYTHTMLVKPNDNDKRIEKINDAIFIKTLKEKLPSEDYVIFNCKPQRNISIMFYTNFIAYDQQLSYSNCLLLKNKKIKLAVIDNGKLPAYLANDSAIIKIPAPDITWGK